MIEHWEPHGWDQGSHCHEAKGKTLKTLCEWAIDDQSRDPMQREPEADMREWASQAGLQDRASEERENKREMGEWDHSMNSAPFGLPHNPSSCEYTRFTSISNFWQDASVWSAEAPHKGSSTLESYFPYRGQGRWGLGANSLKTFANQNNCGKYYIFFLTVLNEGFSQWYNSRCHLDRSNEA